MSQRVDQRKPTKNELLCYDKVLKLSSHIMSVCKPKDTNVNNKHIPKRNVGIGNMLKNIVIEMGADILEANENYYVGKNLPDEERLANYEARIELQKHALQLSYRAEHIFRVLYYDNPFAESTTKYTMDLFDEFRDVLKKWNESDKKEAKTLRKK